MRKVLAVDIGGSKIVMGLVAKDGEVLRTSRVPLPPGFDYDVDFLRAHILMGARALLDGQAVSAVGFAVPAPCDSGNGVMLLGIWSGIAQWNIREEFSGALGLPVFADNDANACAVAEHRFGCCQASGHFLWATVSTGCGGALYLDGNLYRGPRHTAGEIGHLVVAPESRSLCGCGLYGDMEVEASGSAIGRKYLARQNRPPDPSFRSAEVSKLARAGDSVALEIFHEAGFYLGRMSAMVANILNIDKAVLGGGVAVYDFDLLQPGLLEGTARSLFPTGNDDFHIEQTALGYHAALLGAAAIALEGVEAK